MYIDRKLVLDWGVAITDSKVSTNTIDIGALKKLAKGQPIFCNVWCDTAFTSAANELTVYLANSSGATPDSGDTVQTIIPNTAVSNAKFGAAGLIGRAIVNDMDYDTVNAYYLATTALASGYISVFFTIGDDSREPTS